MEEQTYGKVGDLIKENANGWVGVVTYIDCDNNVPLYCIAFDGETDWLQALDFEVISESR